MKRFIAIATEVNVLNLVALRALAASGDDVHIIEDAQACRHGLGQRLRDVIRSGTGLQVVLHSLDQWRLEDIAEAAGRVIGAPGDTPIELHLILIGGAKHDALLLHDALRAGADAAGLPVLVHSVRREPFRLMTSGNGANGAFMKEAPLAGLDGKRTVQLDEVLALHGYVRSNLKFLRAKREFSVYQQVLGARMGFRLLPTN